MRVTSFYATKSFKLILEFDDNTYRIFEIRNIPANHTSPLIDLQFDRDLFLSATINTTKGTVSWKNGVDIDFRILYDKSIDLESLTNIRDFTRTKLDTPVTEAIIALKESIRASKDLIDNYEYFLKHDIEDEKEKEDAKKSIIKLKKEIPSYQKAIEILEESQGADTVHERENPRDTWGCVDLE